MARQPTRLVLSFIGNKDIELLQPKGDELSPIRRVLRGLGTLQPSIPPARTRLLLFDDDKPGCDARRRYCEALREQLPGLGLAGLTVTRCPVVLPEGPTDLNALYEQVWAAIPLSGPGRSDEFAFHISSGTWAMQFTLVLAANCLRLEHVRLLETSRQQGLREVRPPYVLAARDQRACDRGRGRAGLADRARRGLLPDTIVADPRVEETFAALHRAATNRKLPQRVVVQGPVGSGKWHACRQFARWRGQSEVHWLEPESGPDLPEGSTLLVRRLDAWPEPALQRLTRLAAERPDLAVCATFRTDRSPAAPLDALLRDGLRGAVHLELPALGVRADIVALGEALLRQLGAHDGKLKARLQYELYTDIYPHNLHDLKSLLATSVALSRGAHLERDAYRRVHTAREARTLVHETCHALLGMDFGSGRAGLDEALRVLRWATVERAVAEGRTQKEVAALLGMTQQTVSDVRRAAPDLSAWRPVTDHADGTT